MMRLAPEGIPQMAVGTLVLGAGAWAVAQWWPPAALPLILVWAWSIAFFRDPRRVGQFAADELCSPADGRVNDITDYDDYPPIHGPAVRVGVFLSLFDVHINRAPCTGRVRLVTRRPGSFHAAMTPEAAEENECNTLVIEPAGGLVGPVIVRQIVGMAARRIVCHATEGTELAIGERFGLIKFGSRTELIVPKEPGMEVLVRVGERVRAGLTPMVRLPRAVNKENDHGCHVEAAPGRAAQASAATA